MSKELMRKILSLGFACIFLPPLLWAGQIARTDNGRYVLLHEDGRWEYVEPDSEEGRLREVNEQLLRLMRPYLRRRSPVFFEVFRIEIDWESGFWKDHYKQAIKDLHRISKRFRSAEFREKLAGAFGAETADKIIWLGAHFKLWLERYG